MTDRLSHIDEKILQLKKKREKVQAQHALSFLKETQKIFKEDFSPELALAVLTESWGTAHKTKKESWKKSGPLPHDPGSAEAREGEHGEPHIFPRASLQNTRKKNQEPQSADHQS